MFKIGDKVRIKIAVHSEWHTIAGTITNPVGNQWQVIFPISPVNWGSNGGTATMVLSPDLIELDFPLTPFQQRVRAYLDNKLDNKNDALYQA